eukprot:5779800-Pyramimonas_sp.AAC.1
MQDEKQALGKGSGLQGAAHRGEQDVTCLGSKGPGLRGFGTSVGGLGSFRRPVGLSSSRR